MTSLPPPHSDLLVWLIAVLAISIVLDLVATAVTTR